MLYLDVACNDPDNGLFAHGAPALSIGSAEFQCRRAAPRFVDGLDGRHPAQLDLRLAGRRWGYHGSKEWVGNWCWNRYTLAHPHKTVRWYLTDFVTWLRRRSLYSCDHGPSDFFDWFNGSDAVAPARVHELVCTLEERS
ncbi:MAG: hypothetical protein IPK75_01425 [Acidobacteria bacterium]|nr:hypothetical protein [Acidobacteriota bacterium]